MFHGSYSYILISTYYIHTRIMNRFKLKKIISSNNVLNYVDYIINEAFNT